MEQRLENKIIKMLKEDIYQFTTDNDFSVAIDECIPDVVVETENETTFNELVEMTENHWAEVLCDAYDVRDNDQPFYFESWCDNSRITINLVNEDGETINWEYHFIKIHDWTIANSDLEEE
jgi:hypothetical protein